MNNLTHYFGRSYFLLYANYLLIAYAFLLPTFPKAASVVMILIGFLAFTAEDLQNRFIRTVKDRIVIAFLLFYFMHFMWMAGTENLQIALLKVKDFKYILYIIPIAMIVGKEFIPKVLAAFVSGVVLSELISYAMHFGIHIPSGILIENNPMSVPFMESYTQYAITLNLALGIVFYQLLAGNTMKILYAILFLATSLNIFIIESRIGYLLYFATILLILFLVYRQQLFKVWFYFLTIILIVNSIAWVFSDSFKSRIFLAADDIQKLSEMNLMTSLGARAGFYLYSYDVIKDNFVFGVGTGDHITEVMYRITEHETNATNREGMLLNIRSGHNASLHSEYLDILGQFGIVGLLIFLHLLYQIARYPQNDQRLKMVQILIITAILFVSFGTIVFIASQVGKIFILLSALTLLPKTTATRYSRERISCAS